MKKVVVLSGAGISAESGLRTFRDSNGLWENYKVEDVATPEAWVRNPDLVLEFYNQRRKQALDAQPNAGHRALKQLEPYFDVTIVTQNVDNLHEKAGSAKVIHLHGELFKSRSTRDPRLVYDIAGWELKKGDHCEKGSQLRPHIVWFGEAVPMMDSAVEIVQQADILIIVGTSMVVYPAAGLIDFARPGIPIYVVDPNVPDIRPRKNLTFIPEPATTGLSRLAEQLIAANATDGV
ncbi:NAD-dependent deacetylase [Larkinella arboricola]|uniref:NAD-dependent protein deacylase n=1 Tax=Larkinella arboricola TaxID=643671 RepID=A0A327X5I6_LARAB|nr:NAD-dependent deacylase [Larkinella arboricola]RAK00363.1 NAD-dependent deacetylase [Larkinella arboricola]